MKGADTDNLNSNIFSSYYRVYFLLFSLMVSCCSLLKN